MEAKERHMGKRTGRDERKRSVFAVVIAGFVPLL